MRQFLAIGKIGKYFSITIGICVIVSLFYETSYISKYDILLIQLVLFALNSMISHVVAPSFLKICIKHVIEGLMVGTLSLALKEFVFELFRLDPIFATKLLFGSICFIIILFSPFIKKDRP
jgi:hypothetical protein